MSTTYKPRPIHCAGVSDVAGWQLKCYEISAHADPLPGDVGSIIDTVIAETVAGETPDELGLGFVIVHQGLESLWLLIDLWRGDIICQHIFRADMGEDLSFTRVKVGGPTMCIWEMEVQAYERQALINHILNPDQPEVEGYLADQLDNHATIANRDLIERFTQAWNAGEVDDLMALMANHPTYRASTGDEPGHTYTGAAEVRAGFAAVIQAEAAVGGAAPSDGELHVFDDRAFSYWSYPSANGDGQTVLVEGVDLWTFEQGRIALKDAYRKSFRGTAASG